MIMHVENVIIPTFIRAGLIAQELVLELIFT